MAKSGAKIIGVAILCLAIGVPLAYVADEIKGPAVRVVIYSSIILSLTGVALLLLGLFKLVAGLVKRS